MKIVVTVKLVPDTNADKRIDPATKRLVRTGVDIVLNPFDEYAIEAALQLRDKLADGSTVTIATMAPESGREVVRKALAMGADDAVMLSDPGLAGSDLWATAYALAHGIKAVGFDLVSDRHAIDRRDLGRTAGHARRISRRSGADVCARSSTSRTAGLRVKRETETGYQTVSAPLPALASVTKSANEPRYPSLKGIMGAKKKDIKTLAVADLGLTLAVGSDGSRTEVLELATPPAREKGRTVTASDGAEGARAIVDFLKSRSCCEKRHRVRRAQERRRAPFVDRGRLCGAHRADALGGHVHAVSRVRKPRPSRRRSRTTRSTASTFSTTLRSIRPASIRSSTRSKSVARAAGPSLILVRTP